jgi:hypothetical protein
MGMNTSLVCEMCNISSIFCYLVNAAFSFKGGVHIGEKALLDIIWYDLAISLAYPSGDEEGFFLKWFLPALDALRGWGGGGGKSAPCGHILKSPCATTRDLHGPHPRQIRMRMIICVAFFSSLEYKHCCPVKGFLKECTLSLIFIHNFYSEERIHRIV